MATDHLVQAFADAIAHIEKDGPSAPLVTNMMVQCRRLLEGTGSKKTYPDYAGLRDDGAHTPGPEPAVRRAERRP